MQEGGGITRLAPSPTGALHLGHALTFLVNWALARRLGWRVLLRMDDLDAPRVASSAHDPIAALRWLGLDWDGAPVLQRARMPAYRGAMERLAAAGVVFRSPHSRSEVREAALAAGAPQEGDAAVPFPGSLRPPPGPDWRFGDDGINHRLAVPADPIEVTDEIAGRVSVHLAQAHGDFIVWTKAGIPSYQLACAVDDAELGVTDVVRGVDLLPSAAPQQLLHRLLGHASPRWWHVPLVRDAAGRRLAKRDGDEGLDALRARGVTPDRIVGLVAWSAGLAPLEPCPCQRLPELSERNAVVRGLRERAHRGGLRITPAVLAWLTGDDAAADMLRRDA
ncbi:MAG: glutamate--tRNA ligase family protein [Phycisphaerales bacterium]|jgi:glutamyl-tRNA synthetase